MDTLRGARVVVTGSSRGIGQGVVEMFCGEGAHVAGLDVLPGDETAQLAGAGFRHVPCDVADPAEVRGAFAALDRDLGGPPQVLCCVAGIDHDSPFLDTDVGVLDRVLAVNVRGPFVCGQEAARRMRDAGGGRIINIASTASVQGWYRQAAYGASKGAVALLTRCMAVELAPYGIAVNGVGPGTIETPLAAPFLADPAWRANELTRTPLGRLGTPADIANAVRFLARDATWMTGQIVYVDGGFLAAGLPASGGAKAGGR